MRCGVVRRHGRRRVPKPSRRSSANGSKAAVGLRNAAQERAAIAAESAVKSTQLGGWNRRSKFDAPFEHRHIDHIADDSLIKRPGHFDPYGQSDPDQTPKIWKVAAVTGEVNQYQSQSQRTPFVGVFCGLRSVSMRDGLCRTFFAAVLVATRVSGRLVLFLCRRNHEVGRSDAVLVRPGDFFAIGVTAAVVPAFLRRGTAARVVLAGKGPRAVFGDARDDRDPGTSHQK
jgi:hypothetical protein